MKKFTPIAMKCTQEEWESIKNFIPKKLIRKDMYGCFNSPIYASYITNDYNEEGKICSTFSPECQEKRYEIFDAKIFLNACGIDCDKVVKSEKPIHYQTGNNIDIIDFCKMYNLNFNRGNVIKYVSRAGKKDDEIKDLEKSLDFIQREIKYLKEK